MDKYYKCDDKEHTLLLDCGIRYISRDGLKLIIVYNDATGMTLEYYKLDDAKSDKMAISGWVSQNKN